MSHQDKDRPAGEAFVQAFKAYDIRGRVPDQLNGSVVARIGAALSSQLKPGPVVVGRDVRLSSHDLQEALSRGLLSVGRDVIDIGLCGTEEVYFQTDHLGAAGGVMVTASHNPPQYNGFKISGPQAKPIGQATGLDEIKKMAGEAAISATPGRVTERVLWPEYSAHVHSFLDFDALRRSPVTVVIDASNGMAGTMAPRVFGAKGSRVPARARRPDSSRSRCGRRG